MFEAAVSRFAKTVGKESLIPVPSLDEADRCRLFHVVVKRNQRWFWKAPRYENTSLQLNELLVDHKNFNEVLVQAHRLATYNKTYEFDTNGKVGMKLLSTLEYKVDSPDPLAIQAMFGEVTKFEVDLASMQNSVEKRKVDMKHDFVQQMQADPRKTLCVITGMANLRDDGSVNLNGKVSEKPSKSARKRLFLSLARGSGDAEEPTPGVSRQLVIPTGTPIAYSVCELMVTEDGGMQLVSDMDGGFKEMDDTRKTIHGLIHACDLAEQFSELWNLDPDHRCDLSKTILGVCRVPADVQTVLKALETAERGGGGEGGATSATLLPEEIKTITQEGDAQILLEAVGCEVETTGSIMYPTEITPLLRVVRLIFDDLVELDHAAILALRKVNKNYAYFLLRLLSAVFQKARIHASDGFVAPIFKRPNTAQAFCHTLGFMTSIEGVVVPPEDRLDELNAAYRIIFGLWFMPPDPDAAKEKGCVIA